jgi:hypothetical protein
MKFKELIISQSNRKNKRLKATFLFKDGTEKTTHFGSIGGYTYLDGASEQKKIHSLLLEF